MADLIDLPTASTQPVSNPPRRGRPPYGIRSIGPDSTVHTRHNLRVAREREDRERAHVVQSDGPCAQTIEYLAWMLQEARKGNLHDLAGTFLYQGQHVLILTGAFRISEGEDERREHVRIAMQEVYRASGQIPPSVEREE